MSLFGGVEIPGRPDLDNIARLDRLPIHMTRRMSRYGIAINPARAQELSEQFTADMLNMERDIASYIPPDRLHLFTARANEAEDEAAESESGSAINAASSEQIGKLLFDILGVGLTKTDKLKKTKSGDRLSTGKKQLELLRGDHPVVAKILEYRECSKLKTAFTDAIPKLAKFHPHAGHLNHACPECGMLHPHPTWRVHTDIATTRAETGRMASRRPNLMQIPARTDRGGLVRSIFVASPGCKLISADMSQIELRGMAHCADAKSMQRVYSEGKDIHLFTACEVFKLEYGKYADLERRKKSLTGPEKADWDNFSLKCRLPSKNLNFMIGYGASARGLLAQLALSGLLWTEAEGEAFIARWFDLYPEVKQYMEMQHYRARRYGFVWDILGRVRLIPEVRSTHSWIADAGLRQAGNFPIQAVAAGQMKLGMARAESVFTYLLDAGVWVWPLIPVHDELMVEAEDDCAQEVAEIMQDSFNKSMTDELTGEHRYRVPIKSSSSVMECWEKG